MVTCKLFVDDMNCTGCAARVRSVLLNTRGVVKVITNLDEHQAEVTYDEQRVSEAALREALKTTGFGTPGVPREFCDNTAAKT